MIFSNAKNITASAVMVLALGAGSASAATYNFDTWVTGLDLGSATLATLAVDQDGDDVAFTLTNTGSGGPNSWIDYVSFNYGGTFSSFTVSDTSPTDGITVAVGAGGTDASIAFDLKANVSPNGSANGLTSGNFTTWSIADVSVSDFSFYDPNSLIHIGGLANGASTKYTVGDDDGDTGGPLNPVPLPAGLPLLASALGLGLFLRRRRS